MTRHACNAFPKRRRSTGMLWKCPYCGSRWTLVERRDDEWGDLYEVWERAS